VTNATGALQQRMASTIVTSETVPERADVAHARRITARRTGDAADAANTADAADTDHADHASDRDPRGEERS